MRMLAIYNVKIFINSQSLKYCVAGRQINEIEQQIQNLNFDLTEVKLNRNVAHDNDSISNQRREKKIINEI